MSLLTFYKKQQPRNYNKGTYYIEDYSDSSPLYFNVQHFPESMGGGKNVIVLKGNGDNMRLGTTIDVEVLDAEGNNIPSEITNYIDRFNNYYITVDVYDITAKGTATIYLVGEALVDLKGEPVPKDIRGSYNIRWARDFRVLPFDRNNSELIFDNPPNISITQVITPERTLLTQTGSSQWSVFTSSINDYTITTSKFQGYDREFATSPDILDPRLRGILVNPTAKPTTSNTINTALRTKISDIENGYLKELSSRFNTVVTSANRTIQKDFLGATFEFFSAASTPLKLTPNIPTGFTLSGSTASQLQSFNADVVEVISDTQMRISRPLQVKVLKPGSLQEKYTTDFKYSQATRFTASINYVASDGAFVTSSNISQSYLEVTFSDLKPIGGEVYRIKTYYKRGIASGEFKAIYDHIVRPVEYLSEAAYPNQTSYARQDSDYRLIGHFTSNDYIAYWETHMETPSGVYPAAQATITSASLHESIPLAADYTESGLFTTTYNQNYTSNQTYTLSFLVALDPYTELEVYMNSDPVNSNIYLPAAYPRAFARSINKESTRYSSHLNRFGKYIGKIQNPNHNSKYYGRVEFDFLTDDDGLGRPLFRSSITSVESVVGQYSRRNITGSAYVAEVSIRPLTMNGFSPNLVQFAIPFNSEIDNILVLSQSLDFKIEYFDFTGRQSEYITTIDDLKVNLKGEIPTSTCQAETVSFNIKTTTNQL